MDSDKLTSNLKITHYDFDPDATTATDVAWIDMRDISALVVSFFRTVGVSDLTMTILANTASDGSGNEATIKTKVFSDGQPNNVGDYVFLECLAEEVRQEGEEDGYAYRYVSANLTFDTAGDEGVVSYIATPRYKYEDLTSDYIS